MNLTLRTLGCISILPVAFGCAGRAAPFDELDKAPVTIMRLTPEPPPQVLPVPGSPTPLIPGLPPDLQKMGEDLLKGAGQVLPPGLIPPGLLPQGQQQQTPIAPAAPKFKHLVIVNQPIPVTDEADREEILDLFGDDSSFQAQKQPCFTPGMGISITRSGQPPVDLLVSLSCAQAVGDGFQWPHKDNGFTPDTTSRLSRLFQKFFGPLPQSGV